MLGVKNRPVSRPEALLGQELRTPRDWDPALPEWCARMVPMVEAPNKHVTVGYRDWESGLLVMGAQSSGKSSVMLKHYQNAILDSAAAVVLIDPKTSLAKRALAITPPACGKQVWYLNLSRPLFGMSPLRVNAPDQAITDLLTSALRDVFEGQLYQASRGTIENATRGELALARGENRSASLETVRDLMQYAGNAGLRSRVIDALARSRNGDRARNYFAVELEEEMARNTTNTMERLRAPRNKLDGLLNAESLRVFFNHPCEKPLQEIIRDRDILIVDANLGRVGQENSRLMISFILHMLDLVLSQQMNLGAHERSRVHLLIDESSQVLKASTIDMIERHRESGLTPAFALHYLAQCDSPAILDGLLALVANRCMFRTSHDRDAEQMVQVARAVWASVRDTPQSRDRQRITAEVVRDLPRFICLCAWLVNGSRQPAFVGRSYPMLDADNPATGYTTHHLERLLAN